MKYNFRATSEEIPPTFNVSLKEEDGDVDILVNGTRVAFFNNGDGQLYLSDGLNPSLGLPLNADGEIKTV